MSHFTTIQTQVRDLDALRDACGELGLVMLPNAKCLKPMPDHSSEVNPSGDK